MCKVWTALFDGLIPDTIQVAILDMLVYGDGAIFISNSMYSAKVVQMFIIIGQNLAKSVLQNTGWAFTLLLAEQFVLVYSIPIVELFKKKLQLFLT